MFGLGHFGALFKPSVLCCNKIMCPKDNCPCPKIDKFEACINGETWLKTIMMALDYM